MGVGLPFGVGAKVRVTSAGKTQLREINPYGSYMSTSDFRLYIGLGADIASAWETGKKLIK